MFLDCVEDFEVALSVNESRLLEVYNHSSCAFVTELAHFVLDTPYESLEGSVKLSALGKWF